MADACGNRSTGSSALLPTCKGALTRCKPPNHLAGAYAETETARRVSTAARNGRKELSRPAAMKRIPDGTLMAF